MSRSIFVKVVVSDDTVAADKDLQTVIREALPAGADAYLVSDLTDEAERILRADYYEDVENIAQEFAANWKWTRDNSDHFADRESALEWLTESVDGTQRVIYTHQAKLGLLFSDNAGAYVDDFGAEGAVENGDLAWSRLMFAAMERDVIERLDSECIDVNGEPESAEDECGYCEHERQEHYPEGCSHVSSDGHETECDCGEFESA